MPGIRLSNREKQVLEFVQSYAERHGYTPTVAEISIEFRWASNNAAQTHLDNLQRKGVIKRPATKRSPIVLQDWPRKSMQDYHAYCSWRSMINRCTNELGSRYDIYGGRGITVCERWFDFFAFLEDMGERPQGTSIDRIDNDGNYEPGNCRWATQKQQVHNSSQCKLTDKDVRIIRELGGSEGFTHQKIANLFEVSRPAVTNILLGNKRRNLLSVPPVDCGD